MFIWSFSTYIEENSYTKLILKIFNNGYGIGSNQSEWALATNCWFFSTLERGLRLNISPWRKHCFPKVFAQRTLFHVASHRTGEKCSGQWWNHIFLRMGPGLMILATGL